MAHKWNPRDEKMSYAGRGPKGWRRSDEQIKEEACERLSHDRDVDATEIEVSAKDGVITLSGSVVDRRSKRRAEDAVENISGVNDVDNRLRIDQSLFEQAKEALKGGSEKLRERAHQTDSARH